VLTEPRSAVPHEPAAVGVDLGSANTRIWASGRGTLHAALRRDDARFPAN
jgi:hypothetical protein